MARSVDITRLIERSRQGDARATEELMPLIYDQLRALAARHMSRESAGHTLQATALVHEAYLRLADGEMASWQSRAHFFGAAATALRRILVEHARSRRVRRELERSDETGVDVSKLSAEGPEEHILDVDAALHRLEEVNAQQARLVELRFFAGMNTEEIAEVIKVSPRTIARDWVQTKAWLARELRKLGLGER